MFDQQLYHTVLILAGIANLAMAAALLHGNIAYADYTVYRRARRLVALWMTVFAVGFFIHAHFDWRFTRPDISTALSASYFHIGAVLFGWSHTSLLNPDYLTRKVALRDLILLLAGLTAYWCPFLMNTPPTNQFQYIIFFLHAGYITYVFYRTYFRVRHRLRALAMGTTGQHVRWMLLSCHLIIGFGIGSIVLTVSLPDRIWPYTVLLGVGILVFVYIFFSLNDYGEVIDSATNATEDVTKTKNNNKMNKTPITRKSIKLLLTCCLLVAGTIQGLAWDTEPDENGKYDTYYDRPTHFPDWQQPSDWPNAEYYLVCARFGEEGPQVENYEVAVYDQNGKLRHCKRSMAKDNHLCVLTIRGTEGDQFHCQVIYGDDFQNPTIVDVPETFGFKTNDIVGSADKPFGLTVTSLLGDANGDGLVDSADVTAIVNKINGVPQPRFNEKAANVNQDDAVNIADVAGVIKIIISNK